MLVQKTMLIARLLICRQNIQELLQQIATIEIDTQTSTEDKMWQIQKIREELKKIGEEVDKIKQNITLLEAYEVN